MTGAARGAVVAWAALPILVVVSLTVGSADLPADAALDVLWGGGDDIARLIVLDVRLPRTILALLVGGALGLSGAALQGWLRNPLAEPGVTGVSSTAAFGAVLALYFGFASLSPFVVPLVAMVGALAATLFLFALARIAQSVLSVILGGVALASLAVALTTLALNLSPNPYAMSEIMLWLMGSVRDRSADDVLLALPFIVLGGFTLWRTGRALDALSLGEDTAESLGLGRRQVEGLVILGTGLAVGSAVAVAGSIGFVGLVVPHLVRPLVGYRPGAALLPSAMAGALLLLAADIGVRLLPTPSELMLGVVTALIGAPFFFHLVLKTRWTLP